MGVRTQGPGTAGAGAEGEGRAVTLAVPCRARSAAMAAAWRDVVRDAAAVREAAAVAVDAALLAGVLMRTGEQPNASEVSAQRGEEPPPCRGSLSLAKERLPKGQPSLSLRWGCSSQPVP